MKRNTNNGAETMNSNTITALDRIDARNAQRIRELHSDLAALVEAGELTEAEANAWAIDVQDRLCGGDR
jgi:hypothetical protein